VLQVDVSAGWLVTFMYLMEFYSRPINGKNDETKENLGKEGTSV
jgi:hypothetical protein